MKTTRQLGAGTSDPLDFRYARPVAPAGNALAQGGEFVNATPVSHVVAIAGALFVRFRGKFTGGGELTFQYLRPRSIRSSDTDGYDVTLNGPHSAVTVVLNTEFCIDIEPGGESDLLVVFTPSANGEVTFFDVMQQ